MESAAGSVRERTDPSASSELFEAELDHLASLSKEALLTLIGSQSLTLPEYSGAAVIAHASGRTQSELAESQLLIPGPVDLGMQGGRTVTRVLEDWGDLLRPKICKLLKDGADERTLAHELCLLLAPIIFGVPGLVAAVALCIARYFLDKLCRDAPAPAESPVSA